MKAYKIPFQLLILFIAWSSVAAPKPGFFFPDSLQEIKLKFLTSGNLMLLPVLINDSIKVNLVLDTGCRNLVLFGKKFNKLFKFQPDKTITFSGLGKGKPITGKLSLNNKIEIGAISGEQIPVVVIENKNVFTNFKEIHGVIGYDIFFKFEIEINPKEKTISFRPGSTASLPDDFIKVPLTVTDSKPIMKSSIVFHDTQLQYDLLIDTGSSLGLLLKNVDEKVKITTAKNITLGKGFNGEITGYKSSVDHLKVHNFEMNNVTASILQTDLKNEASIGMEVLKDYILVLNYAQSFAGFKKLSA